MTTVTDSLNHVRLDVGHHMFLCHIELLKKYPDSALAKFVSPQFDKRTSSNDFIVIDRDGRSFGFILEHLRGSLKLADLNEDQLSNLRMEANYYCLTDLEEACRERVDNLRRWNASQEYTLPIVTDLGDYLKKSTKPVVVMDTNWIRSLGELDMLDKISLLGDSRSYDLIGCSKDFKYQLRLYNPLVPWVILTQENSKPGSVQGIVWRICKFLMEVDQGIRVMAANVGGSMEELAKFELERQKLNFLAKLK